MRGTLTLADAAIEVAELAHEGAFPINGWFTPVGSPLLIDACTVTVERIPREKPVGYATITRLLSP